MSPLLRWPLLLWTLSLWACTPEEEAFDPGPEAEGLELPDTSNTDFQAAFSGMLELAMQVHMGLACWNDDRHHGKTLSREVGLHRACVQRRDRGVRHQRDRPAVTETLQQLRAQTGDRPTTDQHRVAMALRRHMHVDHERTRALRFAW